MCVGVQVFLFIYFFYIREIDLMGVNEYWERRERGNRDRERERPFFGKGFGVPNVCGIRFFPKEQFFFLFLFFL